MEFKKERVYSAVNADELKPGDKVIVANDLATLKRCVKDNSPINTIHMIGSEDFTFRFCVKESVITFPLVYLVERKENCTNCGEGKWDAEHQKILCDPVNCGNGNVVFRNHEIEVCEYWKPKTEQKAKHDCQSCKYKNCGFKYLNTKNECDRWETEQKAKNHYRPFKDTDELIKTWIAKRMITYPDLCLPHIWVRRKEANSKGQLITEFGDEQHVSMGKEGYNMTDLFVHFAFLDGSPCGVEE